MTQVDSGMAYEEGSADRPDDFNEKGETGISAKYLCEEYSLACKRTKDWHKDSNEIVKRYLNTSTTTKRGRGKHNHNVLYSNTETQRPSLYSDKPIPDVRRRFRDKDPVARRISEISERCLSFTMDDYDWDGMASDVVLDFLLVGRAMTRIRYKADYKEVPEEIEDLDIPEGMMIPDYAEFDEDRQVHFMRHESYEEVSDERVCCELVQWDRFQHGPGRVWEELDWVSYDHYFTMDEFDENFPDYNGKELQYGESQDHNDQGKTVYDKRKDASILKKIKIVELWYKPTRKIYFFAENDKVIVKTEEDQLELKGFFPSPKPVYAIDSTSDLIPVPEFMTYKDQADELDKVTQRIQKLVQAIKARGVYDPTLGIERLFSEDDNKLIPADNVTALVEKGGIGNGVWMLPIEIYGNVLDRLYQAREKTKEVIYEIIGLSDIVRGASDPRETKGAQQIKSQWASSRIKRKQYLIQRYFRDILRMKAEVISTLFSPETVEKMTGLSFDVEGEMDPQTGQRPMLSSREETIGIMQDDIVRNYRVDVETDSTIAGMLEADQQNVTRLLQGIAQYVQGMGGAVGSGFIPPKSATQILLAGIRKFKFGREVEDAIEAIGDQPPPEQNKPDPEVEKQKALLEIKKEELALKQQEMQMKAQIKQQESQAGLQINQMEAQQTSQMNMQEMRAEMDLERQKAMNEMQLDREKLKAEIEMDYEEMRSKINIESEKAQGMVQIARAKADNMPKKETDNGTRTSD
jgi:hypothetical protein